MDKLTLFIGFLCMLIIGMIIKIFSPEDNSFLAGSGVLIWITISLPIKKE